MRTDLPICLDQWRCVCNCRTSTDSEQTAEKAGDCSVTLAHMPCPFLSNLGHGAGVRAAGKSEVVLETLATLGRLRSQRSRSDDQPHDSKNHSHN